MNMMEKAALMMSHTQRGLKDRELMYGLMLILIARILMKVSHLYKDSEAFYWAWGNLVLFFLFFSLQRKEAMIQRNLPCPQYCLQDIYSFFFGQYVIAITSFLNLLVLAYYVIFILPTCTNFSLKE